MIMRKRSILIVLAVLILVAMFAAIQIVSGQGPIGPGNLQVVQSQSEGVNKREIYAPAGENVPQQPDISFIDSPTPYCYQPDSTQDTCYLNWNSMYVDASPSYMVAMTVTLNSIGVVAHYQGFFQTSMSVYYDMQGPGFKVACGAPGAGGRPLLGNAYSWTIQARASDNLKSANYGTTYCPPYTP